MGGDSEVYMGWWQELRDKMVPSESAHDPQDARKELLALALSPEDTAASHLARFEVLGLYNGLGESHRLLLEANVEDGLANNQPWWWACRQLVDLAGDSWPMIVMSSTEATTTTSRQIFKMVAPRLPGLEFDELPQDEEVFLQWRTRVRDGSIPVDSAGIAASIVRGVNGILRDHRSSERLIQLEEYRGETAVVRTALEIAGRAKRAGWASWGLPES